MYHFMWKFCCCSFNNEHGIAGCILLNFERLLSIEFFSSVFQLIKENWIRLYISYAMILVGFSSILNWKWTRNVWIHLIRAIRATSTISFLEILFSSTFAWNFRYSFFVLMFVTGLLNFPILRFTFHNLLRSNFYFLRTGERQVLR